MKALQMVPLLILMVFTMHTAAYAQSPNVTEAFKKHFNETVQNVHEAEHAEDKRSILNKSLNRMITTIDRIESLTSLDTDESNSLNSYKVGLTDLLSELNGVDGYEGVADEDLDEFSSYSQNFIEQANRTITIGVTTALLILVILLLL